jgi:ribosomal protein S18 acetylase RimI-like enzyme
VGGFDSEASPQYAIEMLTPELHKIRDIKIRRARPGDVSEIANVHVNSWRETYRGLLPADYLAQLNFRKKIDAWQSVILKPEQFHVLVAEDRVGVIGFATFEGARDVIWGDHGEVSSIYLLSRFKGRGIGRALLRSGMQELIRRGFRRAYCWVLENNPTISFYEHTGAQFSGQVKDDEIAGQKVKELAYVWNTLDNFK